MTLLDEPTRIAEVEFSAIVTGVQAIELKRRIFLSDGSFVDVWVAEPIPASSPHNFRRTPATVSEPSSSSSPLTWPANQTPRLDVFFDPPPPCGFEVSLQYVTAAHGGKTPADCTRPSCGISAAISR